jgi:hypothetical protein
MQLVKILTAGIVSSAMLALAALPTAAPALAGNVDIEEDKLNPERGLKWGGGNLPLDSLVTIRDSLVNSSVGKLTIDRHGEDNSSELFKSPFAGPFPGRMTIVTLWGSKEEGCFVKALVHSAPKNGRQNPKNLVPVQLEIGVGTQVVKLNPIANNRAAKLSSGSYTYQDGKVKKSASMYYTENTFAVNARVADLFRNAPRGNAKARITFLDNSTNVFQVGSNNVARWRDSYGFNPSCAARN